MQKKMQCTGVARILGLAINSVFAAVWCVSCCSLIAVAQEAKSYPATKTILVRVSGEDDKPLPSTTVHVGLLDFHGKEIEKFATHDLLTNDQGEAVAVYMHPMQVRIAQSQEESLVDGTSLQTLRVSVNSEGYAPMQASFLSNSIHLDDGLPERFEFKLQKGHKLSGHVVDRKGKPIEGARVQVDVDVKGYPQDIPQPSFARLPAAQIAASTDADGYWEIMNAPGPQAYSGDFKVKVNHPDYLGDKEWGDLQKTQRIATENLRDGTSVIKLGKGGMLTGKVTDANGKAIIKGMINWSKLPGDDAIADVNTEIDLMGNYDTGRLSPGIYQFTVCSPGYCPQRREIEIADEVQHIDFAMQKGHVMKLRIVDYAGNAIPHISVVVGKWRGSRCLYQFNRDPKGVHHPRNGLAAVIRPHKDNLFVWGSAPEDEVEYEVHTEWYICPPLQLAARPYVLEKRLKAIPAFFGTVTDQVTGEPIKDFEVIQLEDTSEEPTTADVIYRRRFFEKNGSYRCALWPPINKDKQVRIRIEADGYLPAMGTTSIGLSDEPLQQDFALKTGDSFDARLREKHRPVDGIEISVSSTSELKNQYKLAVGLGKYTNDPIIFSGTKLDNSRATSVQELIEILRAEPSDSHKDASDVIDSDGRLNVSSELGIKAKELLEESFKNWKYH